MKSVQVLPRESDVVMPAPDIVDSHNAAPDAVKSPASTEAQKAVKKGLLATIASYWRAYRQWQAPTGIDIGAADELLADHQAAVTEWARTNSGGVYLQYMCDKHADDLMVLLQKRMPQHAGDPSVREYFLKRGGYFHQLD